MPVLLFSRAALAARSTSIPIGGIVGATIGSVVAAALILLCALPFIRRAIRQRTARRRNEDQGIEEIAEGPTTPVFFSRAQFGDALRRLSIHHGGHLRSTKAYGAGEEPQLLYHQGQNGVTAEKPLQPLCPPGVAIEYGIASPVSPPPTGPVVAGFDQMPGQSVHEGRTATGTLRVDTQTTVRSSGAPPVQISREVTWTDVGSGSMNKSMSMSMSMSVSESFSSPSRQATFTSQGISEEPESMTPGGPAHTSGNSRKRSHHLSDSVRQLARKASAAVRRGSSTKSVESKSETPRSPSKGPGEVLEALAPTLSAPAVFEPVDTEAPGEAYSYYHDVDLALPTPVSSATYGPPISIPAAFSQPPPARTFSSPTSQSTVSPVSPVSPVVKLEPNLPVPASRSPFGQEGDVERNLTDDPKSTGPRKIRGFPEPLQRMDSLPPQSIVSDLPSPPAHIKVEPGVNPMDIMKPTTDTEMDWMVKQELVRMSASPPPVRYQEPPPMSDIPSQPSQPTPDATPEPELKAEQEPEPELVRELRRGPEQIAPPEIAINGKDTDMGNNPTAWSTPPPSSAASNNTTPDQTPETRPTPYTGTPSPRSNDGSTGKPDTSPRSYPCDDCHRVFDQYHKLNHHKRYHERPHECPHQDCIMRFGTKTHLDRHINDKHNKTRKYYCTQYNCPYSRQGGKSFPRKDNWRRHMQNKHNITPTNEPAVEYVDEVIMSGV